jgi:hypothetical protein
MTKELERLSGYKEFSVITNKIRYLATNDCTFVARINQSQASQK